MDDGGLVLGFLLTWCTLVPLTNVKNGVYVDFSLLCAGVSFLFGIGLMTFSVYKNEIASKLPCKKQEEK